MTGQGNTHHQGAVLWFTGLSGAGKTTVADEVLKQLTERGIRCQQLDGDLLRQNLNSHLDFSEEGRKRNIDIAGFVAKMLSDHGVIVIASFISPYQSQRDAMREKVTHFAEVYVNAPLEVCEERDVKGLYKRARSGEIENFTGISHPYEAPTNPDIELHTDQEDVAQSAAHILSYIDSHILS